MKKLFFFLLLLPLLASAGIVHLDEQQGYTDINNGCSWFQNKKGNLSIGDVFGRTAAYPFKPLEEASGVFGRKSGAVFASFELAQPERRDIYLLIDNSNVDTIDVWYKYNGKVIKHRIGSGFPTSSEYGPSARFYIRLLTDGTVQPVLVRANTRNALIMPLFIATPAGLHKYLSWNIGLETIMLGMVLMLALYHLIMLLWTQSRAQLFYVLYLLGLLAYAFLYLRGFSHYLGFTAQTLITEYAYALGGFTNLAALLFTWFYLNHTKVSDNFKRIYKALCFVPAAAILLNLVGFRDEANLTVLLMGFIVPLFVLSFAIASYRKEDKATLFFITGWACVSVGVLFNSMLVLKIFDPGWKSVPQQLLAATCIEMLLLSASLGYRYSQLQKDKLKLKQRLVHILQNQNTQLEEKVAERTADLQAALEQLEESNAVKARVLGIISHDLKMPFVSLNAALDLLASNILSPEKARQKIANVKNSIRQISGTLENLLTWSKHQQHRIETRPEVITLRHLVADAAGLLQAPGSNKCIQIDNRLPENLHVLADSFQIEAVVRNLLSNAIKASKPDTIITINSKIDEVVEGSCRVFVHDTGPGVQQPSLAQWLQQEGKDIIGYSLSNGLGLQICKEFLANHNTSLHYQHDETGSTFSFTLPLAHAPLSNQFITTENNSSISLS